MKFYLSFALFLIALRSMACSCAVMPEIKTKQDVDSYEFIALVKIVDLPPIDPKTGGFKLRTSGDITMQIQEQFKGQPLTTAFDQSFKNDCALKIHKGEQWLFFGDVVNGKLIVGSCDRTQGYSDSTGMRNWWGGDFSVAGHLDKLRQFYGHSLVTNAVSKVFYPNGNVEIEQSFKSGKLNGTRKVYFPNGRLYMTEQFKNGERVGEKNVFFADGLLNMHEEYKNGYVKQKISYHDTAEISWFLNFQAKMKPGSFFGDKTRTPAQLLQRLDSLRKSPNWGKQINTIFTYSEDGRSYNMKMYEFDGTLKAETNLDWNKKISEHTMYYPDGKLESYRIMDQAKDEERSTGYKEDGTKKDYNVKCESCKFYFDERIIAGAPDKVYVQ